MSYFDFVEKHRGYTPGMSGEPPGTSEAGYAEEPVFVPHVRQVEEDTPSPFFGRGSSVVDLERHVREPLLMGTYAKQVLVIGANGVQGSAIARHLAEDGFTVRAAVRTVRPKALPGMEVVAADLDDPEAVRRACAAIDAVV